MIYIMPLFILIVIIVGFAKNVPCFDSFVKGAQEGVSTIVKLVPSLIGLIVAVGVFRNSGIMDIVISKTMPILEKIGMDSEVLPLMLIRPVSGSASLATLRDIVSSSGPDSLTARTACVMMGSTETIFYTMAVYTEKAKIRKLPGVLTAALAANIISAISACIICQFI
ncbi:MAG: spore maturation protein [Clostridia bacterium]|nr:spore maturation protein [Clostridia bacterium]